MTANYSSSSFSPFRFDLNNEDDHNRKFIFNLNDQPSNSSSSSSHACPIFFDNNQQQPGVYRNDQQPDDQAKELLLGSRVGYSSCDHERENTNSCFKSSIIEKQVHDQKQFPSSSENNTYNIVNPIRVCSDCNTTKTPLWRSGPRGPKSLCNACGIRQRKARRAAAMAENGGTVSDQVSKLPAKAKNNNKKMIKVNKEKKSRNNNINDGVLLPFKKRCKLIATPNKPDQIANHNKKICFEDLSIILSKNSAYNQRVFPQDEREAAILLMALSYGLVCG